jgi:hypothetical protein
MNRDSMVFSSSIENNSIELDDVLRMLEYVESLHLMNEVLPYNKEIEFIKDNIIKANR